MSKRVESQTAAFKVGFSEFIPPDLISVFDPQELELLLGGIATLDLVDWKAHTEYRNVKVNDPIIAWFWEIVQEWEEEKRARLVQFVTGTSRVPVGGFRDLQGSDGPRRFTIEKLCNTGIVSKGGDREMLPKSHTCFNRLDLPGYKSKQVMERKLSMAVEETMGFAQE